MTLHSFWMVKMLVLSAVGISLGLLFAQLVPAAVPMEKYVSKQANFVLYKPVGWTVAEQGNASSWSIILDGPGATLEAAKVWSVNSYGGDVLAVMRNITRQLAAQCPDLRFDHIMRSRDGARLAYDFYFTHSAKGKREGRCWITLSGGSYLVSICEAPLSQLTGNRALLLSLLANIRIMRGGFADTGAAPARPAPLKQCQLSDASATFSIPSDWTYQDLRTCQFIARDAASTCSFIVATAEVMTPRLGVAVPNVPVSPYLPPNQAWPFLTRGLISNLQYLDVKQRPDVNQQIAQVYTVGPVQAEELVYTFYSQQGRPCKGYTFGISMGTRLDTSWKFWHLTLTAPQDQFDALGPTYVAMAESYHINERFAQNYIAQGMRRLRELQRQTAAKIARNAEEIHSMMQAAYDERQRSQDYIDYQRTNYIRGEQDWISQAEGGVVYHTDTWGTRNTYTGETWEGAPFDYIHFTGRNPKYEESMTPVDSRELYDKVINPRR